MQVWGSKTIRLYDPEQTQSLYPFANPFLRNTSQVWPSYCRLWRAYYA